MLLGVLPQALEDEILEKSYKPEFQSNESIIAWAKQRVITERAKGALGALSPIAE